MPNLRSLAVQPPIKPMLAKLADRLPEGTTCAFEPKWDGFRAIVFRSARDVFIQSRDGRPFVRYFPDLHEAFLRHLPNNCVLDGEIVIATAKGLDFDALQLRLHPAKSRVIMLADKAPASYVAFDILQRGPHNLMGWVQKERRQALEALLAHAGPPVFVTPCTQNRALAQEWLERFEGAGLDGVIAKDTESFYQPGKRAMIKVKHVRTAECVVGGFRWHKSGSHAIGSLLLGLYDEHGVLQHVGVTSAFTMAMRRALVAELASLRRGAIVNHPWVAQRLSDDQAERRIPGAPSRWSANKDLSWEPVRIERVCEVKYDHLQGNRFRHAAMFLRWRLDKSPRECRYDQLEVAAPYELKKVFGESGHRSSAAERLT